MTTNVIGQSFEVVEEKVAYKRYLQIRHRIVSYPDGRKVDWDVVGKLIMRVGHPVANPCFCLVFPFNSTTKLVTIILEYCQGPNMMLYNLPCGGFDPKKHKR
jgi:hypothetical protein